ncbi:alkaline phosphatase family protein [Alkalihalophilus sp. As8PL]|uniref:Alkaline phosphatase family protein n=1 Tax=Alkalihalophilus sp. As8PL TaxID=3237103 RepID=A0AB39BU12_9BACI
MRIYLLLLLFSIFLILSSCQSTSNDSPEGASIQSNDGPSKKIIVVMVDSMKPELVRKGIKEGRTPAIAFLSDHGKVFNDLISPFPSMSVVIESSLITGVGPEDHHIPGLMWYNQTENRLVDYGTTTYRTFKLGTEQILEDALSNLNNLHLNPEISTIYDDASTLGVTTGSFNMLLYRGPKEHTLAIPPLVHHGLHMKDKYETKGPDLLAFGKLIKPTAAKDQSLPDEIYNQYGLNDQYSTEVIQALIKANQQPNFLMAFLPDFDKEAHEHGPYYLDGFAKADYHLQTILNSYSSWEEAIEENIFIILGDHSQVKLYDKGEGTAIELEPLLEPWTIANLLDDPIMGDFIIANNHRMAYLHKTSSKISFEEVASQLLKDERIDQVAWRDSDYTLIQKGTTPKSLLFKKGGPWKDQYEQTWSLKGDVDVLDLSLDDNMKTLQYGNYPDGLEQIHSALKSQEGSLIITAKPGYILKTEGAPVHYNGGEHGGLHEEDTKTVLIVTGTDQYPTSRRIRDLKAYFLSLLKQSSDH